MNKNILIGIVVIALIAVIGFVTTSSSKDDVMIKNTETSVMEKEVVKNDTPMMTGSYESYSPEKIARAEKGDVVLSFHASWCPSCRGLNADIEKNLSAIPEGLSILKVDYDKAADLRTKYGVTYQHTLVQVDKDGNLIKKWSGSPTLASVISQIQ